METNWAEKQRKKREDMSKRGKMLKPATKGCLRNLKECFGGRVGAERNTHTHTKTFAAFVPFAEERKASSMWSCKPGTEL